MKWFSAFLLSLTLFSCSKIIEIEDGMVINTNQNIDGKKVTLNFVRGEEWSHDQSFGPMKFTIRPQISVWTEDLEGNYLQTLYVTEAFAKQKWVFIKYDPDSTMRAMSFPYWANRYKKHNGSLPTQNNPLSDAVTAATPTGSFTINSKLSEKQSEIKLMVEFNKSFDLNDSYNKKGTVAEFNGQPSLVYGTTINLEDDVTKYSLEYVGHGGEESNDATLYGSDTTITTAQKILKEITVSLL